MKSSKTRLSALACLDETPEQIQAEKREALKIELEKLRNDNQHSWLYRLAAWRKRTVFVEKNGKKANREVMIVQSFLYNVVQCALLVLAFSNPAWRPWVLMLSAVIFAAGAIISGREDTPELNVFSYLYRHLWLPLMPFIRIFDFVACVLPERYFDDSAKEQKIRGLEADLAEFAPSRVVPEYYSAGILAARQELLGEDSELRRTEQELTKRLERLRSNRGRLLLRLLRAESDPERASVLSVAMKDVEKREARFVEALTVIQTTVAKTRAILDECQASVVRLCEPLEDAELLREIQADEAVEAKALQLAQTALTRHVSLVRDRIMQLAGVVSVPVRLLPSGDQTQDIESLFTHIESVAEKVAALECFKPA